MFSESNAYRCINSHLVLFIWFLLAVNLVAGYVIFPTELIQADSQGYIAFSSSRTLGYPVFLWCVHAVFKTYVAVPFFQLFIYSIASYNLAISIKKISKNAIIPYFLLVLLWLNPEWIKCHFQLMTESLSVSLLCFFMAFLIKAHLTGQYRSFLYAGVFFALSVLVRPINLHCLPVFMGALYLFLQKHRAISLKNVAALLIVPCALYTIGSGANAYIHKEEKGSSFFAYNFLGKVGFFATPDVKTDEPEFMKQLAEHTREFREMIQQNESIQNYYQFTASYTDMIRYGILGKIPLNQAQLNDKSFYTKRAIEIIKHYPILYAKDVAIQLSALWLLLDVKTPSEKESMSSFVEKFYVLKSSNIRAEIYFNKRVRPFLQAMSVRLIFGTLFLITLFGLFIPLVRPKYMRKTNIFAFSLASYIIHSGFLCIAMSHEGYPRYAMQLWPALFVAICVVVDYVLSHLMQRRATALHP
ncbi:MAG: hypothetical protein V4482_01615 [Pseudomonadota bacterium]